MPTITVVTLLGDGAFRYDIVVESNHQDNIARIVGGKTEVGSHFRCRTVLLPDKLNEDDQNTVVVAVNGVEAGHIRAVDCREFKQALSAIGADAAECEGLIVGGWKRLDDDEGDFGVRLNAVLPFRFANPRPVTIGADLPTRPPSRSRFWSLHTGKLLAAAAIALMVFLRLASHQRDNGLILNLISGAAAGFLLVAALWLLYRPATSFSKKMPRTAFYLRHSLFWLGVALGVWFGGSAGYAAYHGAPPDLIARLTAIALLCLLLGFCARFALEPSRRTAR
jgi:hypothetical protein